MSSIASTALGHDETHRGSSRAQSEVQPEAYLDQDQASQHLAKKGLKVGPNTLAKWRVVGGGPLFRKFGRKPIYTPADLDTWADEKIGSPRRSTSDQAA